MYLLRWSFQYLGGRKVVGLWHNPGHPNLKETQASCQSTKNLVSASIEARHRLTFAEMVAASINGDDFCQFRWIGCVPLSVGNHKPRIRGMVLVCRDFEVIVTEDGAVVPEARKWNDNIMQYGRIQ